MAQLDVVEVELRRARYEARQLTIEVAVHNTGTGDVTVGREGVLLADGELEFPINADPRSATAPSIAIGPRATETLSLSFDVGGLEPRTRVLRLRQVSVGTQPLGPLSLQIPGILTEEPEPT